MEEIFLLDGWGYFGLSLFFFITQQLFNLSITKLGIKSTGTLAITALTASYITSYLIKIPTPFNITVTLHAFPFMYLGYLVKIHNIKINIIITFLICVICLWFFSLYTIEMKFDMKQSLYGIPFISFITALALVIMTVVISSIIKCKLFDFMGVNSMNIMYIHQFIHLSIANKLFESGLAIFCTTLMISLLYCMVINKLNVLTFRKFVN